MWPFSFAGLAARIPERTVANGHRYSARQQHHHSPVIRKGRTRRPAPPQLACDQTLVEPFVTAAVMSSPALRAAVGGDDAAHVRALADNRQLWTMVMDLVRDPANPLPALLRGQLMSVGLAVAREMDGAAPDLPFLMQVNNDVAAGLSGPAQ